MYGNVDNMPLYSCRPSIKWLTSFNGCIQSTNQKQTQPKFTHDNNQTSLTHQLSKSYNNLQCITCYRTITGNIMEIGLVHRPEDPYPFWWPEFLCCWPPDLEQLTTGTATARHWVWRIPSIIKNISVCLRTAEMVAHQGLCNYGADYKLFLLLLLLLTADNDAL